MTYQIYEMLRQGRISGDEIGRRLSISRAAVNKHIKKLRATGVNMLSTSGIGYEWINDGLINEYSLKYEFKKYGLSNGIICKPTTSTNRDAKELALTEARDMLIVAPYQSKGRGRLSREFESAIGGAYFTLIINGKGIPVALSMRVVLIVGLAVNDMLADYGINGLLKWPNDVFVEGKKITGILMELITEGAETSKIIIGIGINIINKLSDNLSKIATNMKDYTAKPLNIAEIIGNVSKRIYNYIEQLKNGHWEDIKSKYLMKSYNINKNVLCNGVTGIAKGITEEGFLIIDVNGEDNRIITGDVNIC